MKVHDDELLEALFAFESMYRHPPTYQELAGMVGVRRSAVFARMKRFAALGLVQLGERNRARQLRLTRAGRRRVVADSREVPLVFHRPSESGRPSPEPSSIRPLEVPMFPRLPQSHFLSLPDQLVPHVLDALPEEIRPFARYFLPVAVWASHWAMGEKPFSIVVSVADRAVRTPDVGSTYDAEMDAYGPTRPQARPVALWSQPFRYEAALGWLPCDDLPDGPAIHVYLPPGLPGEAFWGRVLTTTGEGGKHHDLLFGPFSGDEAPRDHFKWMEEGGYELLAIVGGVECGDRFVAPPEPWAA